MLDAKVKQLKDGWFEISKTFTAPGSHQYMVIGNFSPLPNETILNNRRLRVSAIFLSVTDIEMHPVRHKSYPDNKALKDSLYAIHKRHYMLPRVDSTPPPPPAAATPKVDTLQINNVRFAFNSYNLANPDTLEILRPYLSGNDVQKIVVIGYTDDTGKETYNQQLSVRRAQEVARQLGTRFQLPAGIIEMEGKGISTLYPQKEMNRRVEIYIYHNSR
ncbi:MAG: OmpA family protein [Bacteroidetes bacterium]|nr:OmpA family protein [Bacteroidota bacterium]